MIVEEIVNRPNNSTFSTEEMQYVVQQYIIEKKGVNVDINLGKKLNKFGQGISKMLSSQQLEKLNDAFNTSVGYSVKKD